MIDLTNNHSIIDSNQINIIEVAPPPLQFSDDYPNDNNDNNNNNIIINNINLNECNKKFFSFLFITF
jgi:hypothetical protein